MRKVVQTRAGSPDDDAMAQAARLTREVAGRRRAGGGTMLGWIVGGAVLLLVWSQHAAGLILAHGSRAWPYLLAEIGLVVGGLFLFFHLRRARRSSTSSSMPSLAAASDGSVPPRPRAMMIFDRLIFLVIAVDLIGLFISFPLLRRLLEADPAAARMGLSFEMVFGELVGAFLFLLGLWFCTSRLRSNIARWVLTGFMGLVALRCVTGAALYIALSPAYYAIALVSALLGLGALWFLFTPASRAWFSGRVGQFMDPARTVREVPIQTRPSDRQRGFGRRQA